MQREIVRSCVACRKRENPAALLRVVCVEGRILPDPDRCAPGRGAWVHRECVVQAVDRGSFRWAFRQSGAIDGSELLAFISDCHAVVLQAMSSDEMDTKDMTLK